MKPKSIPLLALLLLLTAQVPAHAQEMDSGYTWQNKFGRGIVNIFTCPLEIIRGIDLTSKSDGPQVGWTIGLLKGVAGTVLRVGTGVVDIFTCPFNFPNPKKAPLMEPEYIWQEWEGEYHW